MGSMWGSRTFKLINIQVRECVILILYLYFPVDNFSYENVCFRPRYFPFGKQYTEIPQAQYMTFHKLRRLKYQPR